MKKYVNKDGLAYFAQEFYDKTKDVFATKAQVGSPLVAATVAGMTDTDKIYVYVGSETGYTAGDWYYYDGSDWVSGGVYNSVAVQTDTTLSVAGMAADAGRVGEELDSLDGRLDTIEDDHVTESEMAAAISANVDSTLSASGKAADAKRTGKLIAPEFSTSVAYAAGDYVMYQGILYRFAQSHSAGAWNGAEVTSVDDVCGEIGYFINAFEDITGNIVKSGWVKGKYIATNGSTANVNNYVDNANYQCIVLPCSPGDVFYVTAQGASSGRAYAFVANNGDVLEKATSGEGVTELKCIAPDNSAYIVCNDTNGNGLIISGELLIDRVESIGRKTEEINDVKNELGIVENALTITDETLNLATNATLATGGLKGDVGETITISSTTAYRYFVITNVVSGKKLVINTRTSSSSNYKNYVFGTDNSNVITELLGASPYVVQSTQYIVTPGSDTKKLWILVNVPTDAQAYSFCKVRNFEFLKAATKNEIRNNDFEIEALSDSNLKRDTIGKTFVKNISSDTERTESVFVAEVASGAVAVKNKHSAIRETVKVAFITDSHKGGSRTAGYDPSYNIAEFVNVANQCDIAVHGGDIITNYYDAIYMPDINAVKTAISNNIGDFDGLMVPLLVTKGNHELGLSGYTAIETPGAFAENSYYVFDSGTGAYYLVKTEAEFNALVSQGATFYTESITLMTNQEYYSLALNGLPESCVHGETYGGYYYYDYSGIRFIIFNDEYVIDGSSVGFGDTQKSFIQTALSGAISDNLHVVTISHKAITSSAIAQYITSFIGNGGMYIGHIHGHTHEDNYLNSAGFNDIGVNWGCIKKTQLKTYNCAVFDIFEIDKTNKTLCEIRVGAWGGAFNKYRSEDRLFGYEKQVEIV